MLKIGSIKWKGRCQKHPGYNPEIDGLGGIRGGCKRCELLLEIFTHHGALVRSIREFGVQRYETKPKQDDQLDRQLSLL